MPNPTIDFIESGLKFSFESQSWIVFQYDNEKVYKDLSRTVEETKAVDFIGILENENLIFFEVKSFRGYSSNQNVQHRLKKGGEDLCLEIAQKVSDTMAGLVSGRRNESESKWLKCLDIISNRSKNIFIIAWVEQDRNQNHVVEKRNKSGNSFIQPTLRKKLKWLSPQQNISILSIGQITDFLKFKVSHI